MRKAGIHRYRQTSAFLTCQSHVLLGEKSCTSHDMNMWNLSLSFRSRKVVMGFKTNKTAATAPPSNEDMGNVT